MKVLVTGGTGYLGSAIVRCLKASGHQPVVFARSLPATFDGEGFAGDVRDRGQLHDAARRCDAICHTAALVAVGRPRRADFDEINVGGLENVLYLATAGVVGRLVYTSSFMALPPGGSPQPVQWNDYQRTKVIADRIAQQAAASGTPIVTMYPGVIYGPGPLTDGNLVGRSIADHLAGRLPGVIGAARLWSFAFVDDVAAAHVAALEHGTIGARYIVGGENAPQMRPYELVRERLGRPLPRRIPVAVAMTLGLLEQARARLLHKAPILTAGTARILSRDWALDSRLAVHELGYRPRPLAEGVALVLAGLERAA